MISSVVEGGIIRVSRRETIVKLRGFAIIDCLVAAETAHEIINGVWHMCSPVQVGLGMKVSG
jgi:hypothetical protein